MYLVEIQSYDYFGGTKLQYETFNTLEEAQEYYNKSLKNDYDFGDSYRITKRPALYK